MTATYVFAFDMNGFESIVNLTEVDEKHIAAKLADEVVPQDASSIVQFLTLRARFNQERRLEVWALGVDDGITENDLWAWAENDPQDLADKLRSRGHKIFANPPGPKARIV